jgi:hypothetical protein
MHWVAPAAWLLYQLIVVLGPVLRRPRQTTTPRVQHHPVVEPDNWKCPSPAEFAQILHRSDSHLGLPIVEDEPTSSSARAHPLWDRELDF